MSLFNALGVFRDPFSMWYHDWKKIYKKRDKRLQRSSPCQLDGINLFSKASGGKEVGGCLAPKHGISLKPQ